MIQKTITIDVRMLNNSGIGVYIEYMIKGLLLAKKYNIVLVGNKIEIEAKFNLNDFHKIVDLTLPIYSLSEQFYFPFIVPRCDIFWSPHYNVPLLPIAAKKRIVTIHDTYHLTYSKTLNVFKILYAKVLLNRAVKLSKTVLTVSEFSKNEIIKFTNSTADKIKVIYNGIDLSTFVKISDRGYISEIRGRLNLPEKYILFVGNVKPNKNLHRLLKAFLMISNNHPGLKLVIVGKKDGFISGDREVYRLIEQDEYLNSHVQFTGYVTVSDLPIIYNLAILLAFPSIYEGFGLPPLEAMACECPVVVSSVASIPEICGNAAQYVSPFETESISEGMDLVLSNETLRLNLVELGKERIKNFDWSTSVKKFISIIDRM